MSNLGIYGPEFSARQDFLDGLNMPKYFVDDEYEQAYKASWVVSEQENKADPKGFRLRFLIDAMENTPDEWYGNDFDLPIKLLKQVLEEKYVP